jgi:hypothetical protein
MAETLSALLILNGEYGNPLNFSLSLPCYSNYIGHLWYLHLILELKLPTFYILAEIKLGTLEPRISCIS